MSWLILGIIVVSIIMGIPIALSLFTGVALFVMLVMDVDPVILATVSFARISNVMLIAVPLFVLSGYFMSAGGIAKPLVDLLSSFMRHVPGGPAYVMIMACTLFAAMTSSSWAAIAAFGPLLVPVMVEMGYSRRFSIGLLLACGGLGPLIPPSVLLIIYGIIAGESVRLLYGAAFLPGLVIAALLALTVFIHSRRGHFTRLPAASWAERWQAFKKGWPLLLMPPAVLLPIYLGVATATEAASICVMYSLILGVFVYRGLKFKQIRECITKTLYVLASIYAIIMAAFLLNIVLTDARIPLEISDKLIGMGLSKEMFLLALIAMYFVMGMFLDPTAILMISVPIMLPAVRGLDISPLLYGIVVCVSVEISLITPPYGIDLFAAVAILQERFHVVARAVLMFLPALIVGLFLVSYIPAISSFLPSLMK
ncbi:TRAP transporter large permease, partial [Chloroflexota bacterium]